MCVGWLLLASVLVCGSLAAQGPEPQGAALMVHSAQGGESPEQQQEEGDLDLVHPTEQWQSLKPGQVVPSGSHVRLNLQTGHREVRLGEQQLKWVQDREGGVAFSPEDLKQEVKKKKQEIKAAKQQYRPLEELKEDLAQLDLLVETDVQVMKRLLQQFNSSSSTTEHRLGILQELEYLVHQVDNAHTLCSMGGLQVILQSLNSSDVRMQESAAFVLGSALCSNPVVQVKAAEGGALLKLMAALATSRSLQVKKKVLFAVASLLRHFPLAQHQFLSHGGLQLLEQLFIEDTGGVLRTRIVTMLYDLISEKELTLQAASDQVLDPAHQERLRQYSQVSVQDVLMDGGWCTLVPQLLQASGHDCREKALRALLAMAGVCLDQYRSHAALQSSLLALRETYLQLMKLEDSGYFEEMVELIDALQRRMR